MNNIKLPYRLVTNPTKQEIDAMITASIITLENLRFSLRQDNSSLDDYKSLSTLLWAICKDGYKDYMNSSYFNENEPKEEINENVEQSQTSAPLKEEKIDNISDPAHYGGNDNPYEVIKVIEAWELDKDAYLFNVVKYVARAGKKDKNKEIEDLEKARYYLDRKINNLKNK